MKVMVKGDRQRVSNISFKWAIKNTAASYTLQTASKYKATRHRGNKLKNLITTHMHVVISRYYGSTDLLPRYY